MKSTTNRVDVSSFDGHDPRLLTAQQVRTEVFVHEQGVPMDIEQDGRDPVAMHVLAVVDGVAMGAARIRWLGSARESVGKVERVAVLARGRRLGLGTRLMAALESLAVAQGCTLLRLGAQEDAIPFYVSLGYQTVGAPFVEAGIPHRTMEKRIAQGTAGREAD